MTDAASGEALCIIPARGGSQRFPRKNLARLHGTPLVGLAVQAAKASAVFRHVCVSSEDAEVLDVARSFGADFALERSVDAAAYERQVKDICLAVLDQLRGAGHSYAVFGVLLPTSPLRSSDDVRRAYAALAASGAECVMTLTPWEHPPQRALAVASGRVEAYFGTQYLRPAEELETLYRHDGTAIFALTDAFVRARGFYELQVAPYVVASERAVDVDSPLDLAWAEFLAAGTDRARS